MAIDLEAIRRRVKELSGERRSSVQLWKPGMGEFKVRGLPWKAEQTTEGMPFVERWFYYIGSARRFLAPNQFGKPDPIQDLMRKLYQSGKADDRVIAKELQPRLQGYMPVIVRGEEDKGVQVWSFSPTIMKRLLSFYTSDEAFDPLDPSGEGFDLKVKFAPSGKMFNNKPTTETTIDPARKSSRLSDDDAQMKSWLDAVPNIDDMYEQKSFKEIEGILNNWLSGGDAESTSSDGTQKGDAGKKGDDELSKLADDLKSDSKPVKAKKPAKAAPDVDEEAPARKSLDAAFAELTKNDDEDE